MFDYSTVAYDEENNEICIEIIYDREFIPKETDVGIMSNGYAVCIEKAVIIKTGKLYDYNDYEEKKWKEEIEEYINY